LAFAKVLIMRILWTILFGALVTLLFGAVVVRDARRLTTGRVRAGRMTTGRVRRLLTVEEAIRWRPE